MSSRLEYEILTNLCEENIRLNNQEHILALKMVGVTEASELEALNEGFAEVVRGYMNKVMQSTQGAWDKFKSTISKAVSDMILSHWKPDEIRKALSDNSVEGVPINNYSDYNLDKLGNYKIKQLNYQSMQSSLESVDEFLKTNYRDIYTDEKANLKDGLRKLITDRKVDSYTLKSDDMKEIGDFVLQGYKELQNKIQTNINQINNSAGEVDRLLSTNTAESSVLTIDNVNRMYFSEAEEEDDGKMKIASPEKKEEGEGGNGEKKENANSTMKTHIINYMKGTTKVLTAQMAISNEILILYTRILVKYMRNWESSQKQDKSEKSNNEKSTDNSKIQRIK